MGNGISAISAAVCPAKAGRWGWGGTALSLCWERAWRCVLARPRTPETLARERVSPAYYVELRALRAAAEEAQDTKIAAEREVRGVASTRVWPIHQPRGVCDHSEDPTRLLNRDAVGQLLDVLA